MLRATLLLVLLGCEPLGLDDTDTDTDTDTDSDTDTDTDTDADTDTDTDTGPGGCEGTAPEVEGASTADGPMIDDDGNEVPSVLFTVQFADADGDANVVTIRAWFDDTFDGAVDTSGDPDSEAGPVAMQVEGAAVPDCEGFGGALSFALGVNGRELAYDTPTDFALAVSDKAGLWSEAFVLGAVTPSEP